MRRPTFPDVRRVIDSTMFQAGERLRRGDFEALWDLYADDAIYMWDNQPMWRGKAEARRESAKVLENLSIIDHRQTTDDILVCGILAIQAGRCEHTLRRRNGEEFKNSGKNLIAWMRRRDGSWKIVRNLGNDERASAR